MIPAAATQEASAVLTFAPDVTRPEMLRAISRFDLSGFPRIRYVASIEVRDPVRATITVVVACPWPEDPRPLLEAMIDDQCYGPLAAGAVASHRVIGVRR